MALLADKSADVGSNLVQGRNAQSLTFTMPGGVALKVLSVVATINNGAAVAVTPELTIKEASGAVIATKRQGSTIPAGDTGTATFALRLDADSSTGTAAGFIKFDFDNVGDWLNIETTGEGSKFVGFSLIVGEGIDDREGDSDFTFGRDWNISGGNDYNVVFGNDINLQSVNDTNIVGRHDVNLVALNNGAFVSGTSGVAGKFLELRAKQGADFGAQIMLTDVMQLFPQTTLRILLNTGQKVEVQDHNANPIFRINEDGSLQGKTGKALTFNL